MHSAPHTSTTTLQATATRTKARSAFTTSRTHHLFYRRPIKRLMTGNAMVIRAIRNLRTTTRLMCATITANVSMESSHRHKRLLLNQRNHGIKVIFCIALSGLREYRIQIFFPGPQVYREPSKRHVFYYWRATSGGLFDYMGGTSDDVGFLVYGKDLNSGAPHYPNFPHASAVAAWNDIVNTPANSYGDFGNTLI